MEGGGDSTDVRYTFDAIPDVYIAVSKELRDNVVKKIRTLANACCASDSRREDLQDIISEGNEKGWWKDKDGCAQTMGQLALLRDVDTRWSSIYYMVKRLLHLYLVSYSSITI